MQSLQNIPFLWKANNWRSKSCHFPRIDTLFWIAPKLTMRKWWPLCILWITLSTSWALMWFSSALAILSLGSVFTFPLAAFYPESHWPLSALKQGGVQLGCLGSCCEYVRRKKWHYSQGSVCILPEASSIQKRSPTSMSSVFLRPSFFILIWKEGTVQRNVSW